MNTNGATLLTYPLILNTHHSTHSLSPLPFLSPTLSITHSLWCCCLLHFFGNQSRLQSCSNTGISSSAHQIPHPQYAGMDQHKPMPLYVRENTSVALTPWNTVCRCIYNPNTFGTPLIRTHCNSIHMAPFAVSYHDCVQLNFWETRTPHSLGQFLLSYRVPRLKKFHCVLISKVDNLLAEWAYLVMLMGRFFIYIYRKIMYTLPLTNTALYSTSILFYM